ncbi:MAG: hypothetical protein KF847_14230 [Pirellulales bacterium]|nr:hypothetical protein [Pirellulales bacterium]
MPSTALRFALTLAAAVTAIGAGPGVVARAALTVTFDLAFDKANGTTPVPTNVQNEIISAINAAMGMFNEWSNHTKNLYVTYNSGVATADGNFNGSIRFGPSAAYRTPNVAFHEINHVLGAGTYGAWASNVDNNAKLWLGTHGNAMSQKYFPANTLKADLHIHWVGGGTLQNIEMNREGVHILGAIRQDMGLSRGNLYDVLGDFSNNGAIGLEDYVILQSNLHTSVAGLSPSQAWLRGDFNVDGVIDYNDLVGFTAAYNAVHGQGRLELAIGVIPEPACGALAAIGGALIVLRRRRPRFVGLRGGAAALVAAMLAGAGGDARAQLIYVDASTTGGSPNTGPASAFLPGMNNQADDNLWSLRTGFSSHSTFFQSGDGDGEDSPEIHTTISSLTPGGLYQVYVHFWDGSGTAPDWNIRAGFASNPGANTLFANPADAPDLNATPATLASTLSYAVVPTVFVEADRTMFAGLVGTARANASGQIRVYIDDLPSTIGVNNRTWYDGLSYQPTTLQTMSLRVNTLTGAVSLRNDTGASIDLKYYEISSASGAFDPVAWNSLDDQEGNDPPGVGWFEAGGSSATILSEYNLQGSKAFAPGSAAPLGKAFAIGGTEDVVFRYALPNQSTLTAGFVDYVATPTLPGDFNFDDLVDGADLAHWAGEYGAGDLDGSDFLVWQRYVGTAAATAAVAAVPEPTAWLLGVSSAVVVWISLKLAKG